MSISTIAKLRATFGRGALERGGKEEEAPSSVVLCRTAVDFISCDDFGEKRRRDTVKGPSNRGLFASPLKPYRPLGKPLLNLGAQKILRTVNGRRVFVKPREAEEKVEDTKRREIHRPELIAEQMSLEPELDADLLLSTGIPHAPAHSVGFLALRQQVLASESRMVQVKAGSTVINRLPPLDHFSALENSVQQSQLGGASHWLTSRDIPFEYQADPQQLEQSARYRLEVAAVNGWALSVQKDKRKALTTDIETAVHNNASRVAGLAVLLDNSVGSKTHKKVLAEQDDQPIDARTSVRIMSSTWADRQELTDLDPVSRIRERCQDFYKTQAEINIKLSKDLKSRDRLRHSTCMSKFHELSEDVSGTNADSHPLNFDFRSNMDSIRLKSQQQRVTELINNYKRNPWIRDLMDEVYYEPRVINPGERYMLEKLKQLVEEGGQFTTQFFLALVKSIPNPEYHKSAFVQNIISYLRDRVLFMYKDEYIDFLQSNGLFIPEELYNDQDRRKVLLSGVQLFLERQSPSSSKGRRTATTNIPSADHMPISPRKTSPSMTVPRKAIMLEDLSLSPPIKSPRKTTANIDLEPLDKDAGTQRPLREPRKSMRFTQREKAAAVKEKNETVAFFQNMLHETLKEVPKAAQLLAQPPNSQFNQFNLNHLPPSPSKNVAVSFREPPLTARF
eukprot:GILK01007210.1.p1 GENE.GILK01007210.1~~GILK01007210.1.p1  ORF type:complete len:676 (+),score=151.36 GILK01007210.1:200-2227(+)